ncbi:MAG TPA: hypothetical protein VIW80_06155 [Pyrinomonadaceae bacterium]
MKTAQGWLQAMSAPVSSPRARGPRRGAAPRTQTDFQLRAVRITRHPSP